MKEINDKIIAQSINGIVVKLYDRSAVPDEKIAFAVVDASIPATGEHIFCRHKERDTWEIPGGHREPGETIWQTARRELYEESGARCMALTLASIYSVSKNGEKETYGALFLAAIAHIDALPPSEIDEIILSETLPHNLTYPEIQGALWRLSRVPKKYDTLLFDADHTLFDFNAAEKSALCCAMERFGYSCTDEMCARYHVINEQLWKMLERREVTKAQLQTLRFSRLFSEYGITDIDTALMRPMFLDLLADSAQLLPGTEPLCRELHKQGYRMAIVTNGIFRTQKRRLEASPIKAFFEDMFVSEEIGFEKPDKRYFDSVLSRLGITDKRSVLVIGDSLSSDVLGAVNAGLDAAWFNPGALVNHSGAEPVIELYSVSNERSAK